MKVVGTIIVACTALAIYTTNLNAYNYIFLKGKGVGGEMMCSDWIRASKTNPSETAAMTQWVFGFVTGYDTAIRPNPSDGYFNGRAIANEIVEVCKQNPRADLVSVAKYIATYIQKEINGEISPPIIVNTGSGAAPEPDPDRWLIVKDVNRNTCTVSASKPTNDDLVILTSFKAYMIGGKAMKDMVVAECGCDKGCNFELPHKR
jgi:hypothetical protein